MGNSIICELNGIFNNLQRIAQKTLSDSNNTCFFHNLLLIIQYSLKLKALTPNKV